MARTGVARSKQKPFGEKLRGFLKEFPGQCDVTFSVGPQKRKIKSLRVALMASSPAIHTMFRDKWDTAVTNQGDGIPLPQFEPNAFETFLKILMSDDWSADGIKEMNLSTGTVFKLIEISKTFKVLDLEMSLNESTAQFFKRRNFDSFVKSREFLKLPRETLDIILSSKFIALDEVFLFDAAVNWAKSQCSKRAGENLRHALGPAIFHIRFPLMSSTDFSNVVGTTGILSEVEELQILKFILLSDQNKATFDVSSFPFKTEIRQRAVISSTAIETLKFFEDSQIVDSPHVECDGRFRISWLSVDERIAVESVGFLGPVNGDSLYEVSVEIEKIDSHGKWTSVQKVEQQMKVKCKEKFEIAFNPPVVLEATYIKDEFKEKNSPYYKIKYFLKGKNTQSVPGSDAEFRKEVTGIAFYLRNTPHPKPLQFLKFKRV